MISVLKFPFSFEPSLLKEDLQKFSADEWTPHFNTRYYSGDWSGIALRSPGGVADKIYPDPNPKDGYENTGMLKRCEYVPKILAEFKCELESARFLKLSAGSSIKEHKDYNLGYEDGYVRVHIPVQTSPQVDFFLNQEKIVMKEGEAWYLNFNLNHSVQNNSSFDRVHLVIDCVLNDWLDQFFTDR